MSDRYRISIAMAVYNGERFIKEQLDSFLTQTRVPDELVVSDNASTDRTVEIVREFANHAPFPVRLSVNELNLGVSKNFERAIEECSGDLIFLSDCDDSWYAEKIATMEEALVHSPTAGIAVCDADLVDEDLRPVGRTLRQAAGCRLSLHMRGYLAKGYAFASNLPVLGCCLALRSDLRSLILPFPDGEPFVFHDAFTAWTICLSGAGGIVAVPTQLLAYRQHAHQVSGVGPGARGKVALLTQRLSRARKRPPFRHFIERLESPVAILCSKNEAFRRSALRHLRSRWNLSERRAARVPVVLQELLSGRYHRFSYGLAAAVKDLFFVE